MHKRLFVIILLAISAIFIGRLLFAQSPPVIAIDNLQQGLKADKDIYGIGEKITFTFALRNTSAQPITYDFSSAKQFDLWITLAGKEVYRLSSGRVYATVITSLVIQPGDYKTFTIEWDQRDNSGNQVGPGVYTVYAQLTPMNGNVPSTSTKVQVGGTAAAVIPANIRQVISLADSFVNRRVSITATYRGLQPDHDDANVKDGPPITRSDWVICDNTGCLYVNGASNLDPVKDVGTKVTVTGKIKKTSKGQVYIAADSVVVSR